MSKDFDKSSSMSITMQPIAYLRSPLSEKFGTPRQPNLVDTRAQIIFHKPFNHADAVKGLEQFSHIWLIWHFHDVAPGYNCKPFKPTVRPPRLGGNEKVGVFASRSMFRPNNMGLSVVQLEKVESTNGKTILHVIGADLIDKTPILDIKPYLAYSDSITTATCGYAKIAPTNHLTQWADDALLAFNKCCEENQLLAADQSTITQLVALDPRPAYHTAKSTDVVKIYTMRFKVVDVLFYKQDEGFMIVGINTDI